MGFDGVEEDGGGGGGRATFELETVGGDDVGEPAPTGAVGGGRSEGGGGVGADPLGAEVDATGGDDVALGSKGSGDALAIEGGGATTSDDEARPCAT